MGNLLFCRGLAQRKMNTDTTNRIRESARSIEKFRALDMDEQRWLEPLVTKTTKTCLNILDAIAHQPLTYEEIAQLCDLHPTTVKQILNALNEGGCSIDLRERGAFAPTGRSRNLAYKPS